MEISDISPIEKLPMIIHRKIGRLRIFKNFLEKESSLSEVLKVIRPIRIDYFYEDECFEYTCYSDYFEKCDEGSIIPKYDVIINTSNNEIKFVKIGL